MSKLLTVLKPIITEELITLEVLVRGRPPPAFVICRRPMRSRLLYRLNAFSYSTFKYTICLINTRASRSLISTKTRNQGNKHTRNTKGKGRKQRKTVQGLSGNRKPIGLMSRNHLCVSNFHGLLKS